MVLEMVAISLAVLANIPANTVKTLFSSSSQPHLVSPLPQKASTPTNTPTPTQTPSPTLTPTITPSPTPAPTNTPTPTPILITGPELENIFSKMATDYSIDKDLLKRIAHCESGFNTNATNGTYAGLYQFAEGSWTTARNSMGQNPDTSLRFNPEEAVKTAAFLVSQGHLHLWPNCNR